MDFGEANIIDDLNSLSLPPDQDATNDILILNDDCLRNVLERLNLLELSSAAEVCVRFNRLAKDIFRSKYNNFTDDIVDFCRLRLFDIEIVLRNFGSLIESLQINENILKKT